MTIRAAPSGSSARLEALDLALVSALQVVDEAARFRLRVAAAALHNDVLAATLAGAAAGFAVNREPDRNGSSPTLPPAPR